MNWGISNEFQDQVEEEFNRLLENKKEEWLESKEAELKIGRAVEGVCFHITPENGSISISGYNIDYDAGTKDYDLIDLIHEIIREFPDDDIKQIIIDGLNKRNR